MIILAKIKMILASCLLYTEQAFNILRTDIKLGSVLNFLLLVLLIIFVVKRVAHISITEKFGDMVDEVIQKIMKSDDEKRESEKELILAKEEVVNLPNELKKIEEDAENTVSSYKAGVEKEIQITTKRLETNAQKIVKSEEQKVVSQLQRELSSSAIESAVQKTMNILNNNPQMHRKLIADAIEKIEELNI